MHQLCRKGFIGISHTTTSSGGTQALMEIIRLIYWIGIAANKCVAKVVSLVRGVGVWVEFSQINSFLMQVIYDCYKLSRR